MRADFDRIRAKFQPFERSSAVELGHEIKRQAPFVDDDAKQVGNWIVRLELQILELLQLFSGELRAAVT